MQLDRYIDSRRDDMVRWLQGCIQIPSVYADDGSGHPYGAQTARCLEYVLSLARELGFSVRNMDGHLGWCEYGRGEEMAAVLCHLDVVPEGDGWTVPPYGGVVKEGRVYGRGAMDDKGPAMAALCALAAVRDGGAPLKRRIRILFGLNEETGSADMKYYLSHGGEVPVMGVTPDGEYPVINGEKGLVTQTFVRTLEQTGPVRLAELKGGEAHNIVPAHAQARLACGRELAEKLAAAAPEKITCTLTEDGLLAEAAGAGAHGGTPWEGENAIGRLMCFLDRLPLEGDLKKAVRLLAGRFALEWDGASLGIALEDPVSGKLTMNLGVVRLDGQELTVQVNYRYPVTKSFEDCGPAVLAAFEEAGFRQTFLQHKESLYMAPDSPLVTRLLKVYRDYTGDQTAAPKVIGGGTYAKMMPNTLAFGPIFPGDEVREHKPDEFIEIDRLLDNAKILAAAMYELAN